MVFGADTFREHAAMLAASPAEVSDPWVTRMRNFPATVLSSTLREPLDWPDATVVTGDAVDVVTRLKEESDVPLRSHGSLSLNRTLLAAGLVDRRLRSGTAGNPDPGRPHAGADLPAHGARRLAVTARFASNRRSSG